MRVLSKIFFDVHWIQPEQIEIENFLETCTTWILLIRNTLLMATPERPLQFGRSNSGIRLLQAELEVGTLRRGCLQCEKIQIGTTCYNSRLSKQNCT